MSKVIVFRSILYVIMQLERGKVEGYKSLCLFKTIPNALRSVPALLVVRSQVRDYHTWCSMSSADATRRLSIYRSLLPRPGQSVVVCSRQGRCVTGRRCKIASGWYATLRQVTASAVGVGDINRRPSSLRLCDLQGHRYCK